MGERERKKEKKQRSERGKHGDRWGKYMVSQEIVAKHGRNSFKRKSQNMTKPADEYPQPFPHVLSGHV